jgi:hypothetical protein
MAAVAAFAGGGQAMLAEPAFASCAADAGVRSAHAFVGTVIGVTNASRTATVRTDDGRIVTVYGGPGDDPNVASSVDRTYQLGGRYEFDPTNDTDPYQDDICTATVEIAAPFADPIDPTHPGGAGSVASGLDGLGSWSWPAVVGAGAGMVVAVGIGAWLLRRRARSSS